MHPSAIPLGRLSDTAFIAVDVETTGTDEANDAVVEVAAVKFVNGQVADRFESLVDPLIPIPIEASVLHHITAQDVYDSPTLGYIEAQLLDFCGNLPIVAHNADFDRAFLPMLDDGRPWVDTFRAARHVWPDAPRHNLTYLRFWLDLECPEVHGLAAHRAAADALVAGHLARHIMGRFEWDHPLEGIDDLVSWIASPLNPTTFNYGKKWRGRTFAEISDGFYRWLLGDEPIAVEFRGKIDADTMLAVEREIASRAARTAA